MQIPTLQQLLEAGVHFGHQVRRGNPRMKPFIYGAREGVHIIDLMKSEKQLREAVEFVTKLGEDNKVLLFVGTKKQAKTIVEELAQETNSPYLSTRWIGGFLTNFSEIKKNIDLLNDLKEKKLKGELVKFTKKEQLLLDRKSDKLEQDLGGVVTLAKLPDAVFLLDGAKEDGAIKEASRLGIKVIAIADSNCDPTLIDFPIPGNDDAIKSIKLLAETIAGAYGEGLQKAGVNAKKEADKKVKEAEQVAKEEELPAEVKEEVAAVEEKIEKEDADKKVE